MLIWSNTLYLILNFGPSLTVGLPGLLGIQYSLVRERDIFSSQEGRSNKMWYFCTLKIFFTQSKIKSMVHWKSKISNFCAVKIIMQNSLVFKFLDFQLFVNHIFMFWTSKKYFERTKISHFVRPFLLWTENISFLDQTVLKY